MRFRHLLGHVSALYEISSTSVVKQQENFKIVGGNSQVKVVEGYGREISFKVKRKGMMMTT